MCRETLRIAPIWAQNISRTFPRSRPDLVELTDGELKHLGLAGFPFLFVPWSRDVLFAHRP